MILRNVGGISDYIKALEELAFAAIQFGGLHSTAVGGDDPYLRLEPADYAHERWHRLIERIEVVREMQLAFSAKNKKEGGR